MQIEQIPLKELTPYTRNSRTHSEEQITQVVASIVEYGWTNPVLIDDSGMIIAGHGRTMAAARLKMTEVPCIRLSNLSENQKRAYIIADNQIALNAGWDEALLHEELEALKIEEYDLQLLGFSDAELDDLLTDTEEEVVELPIPEPPVNPTTKLGEIYQLGNHRLMCGDSTSIEAVDRLMDGQKADMVFTDPPYGISIVSDGGKVGGDSLAKTGDYAAVAGDDSIDVAVKAIDVIKTLDADVEIIWGGNYYADALENSSCWIVWDKRGEMAGNNFADCELAWTNQKTAVRKFTHLWSGMIKASEHGKKRVHPTQKPIALAEWCFDTYGKECNTVLDLFGGSGSTLIACEKTNRNAYLMELDPKYCDVIIERWENFTNKKAVKVQ